jgi:hypothetical protein
MVWLMFVFEMRRFHFLQHQEEHLDQEYRLLCQDIDTYRVTDTERHRVTEEESHRDTEEERRVTEEERRVTEEERRG